MPQSVPIPTSPEAAGDGRAPARAITRGVQRLLTDLGSACLLEFTLANGRRADVFALDAAGGLAVVEVKSCLADFLTDHKWEAYLPFCERFYFAVDEAFPRERLPEGAGLIIADAFGGAIVREGPERPIAPARRKALTLGFARTAAMRLTLLDLDAAPRRAGG